MPQVLSVEEVEVYADDKRLRVTEDQEAVEGPIALYEAMARALKYNLDSKVEAMEVALRTKQLDLAHYSLLPEVIANTGYTTRNNFSGGSSLSLLSRRQSLEPSTSSERQVFTADLSLSWHVLDFGLSYIRAQQTADRILIAEENKRKVVNRIIEDVRSAYWKAVSAKRLKIRLRSLSERVSAALEDSRSISDRAEASPLTALTYERELVEIKRQIQKLDSELSVAKTQLAALMNIEPGTNFTVMIPSGQPEPRILQWSAYEMITLSLEARPELREVAYQTRINAKEAEAAILEMLPGVSTIASTNYDSNDFLFNNNWATWGMKASWNLLKVFSYRSRRAEIDARDALLDQRALAVTMAIMTQVHVARVRLIHARRQYKTARHYYDVQRKILRQIRSGLAAEKISEQTAIREEMNTLVARVRLDLAYVELQTAFANCFASMGIDPFGETVTGYESVSDLAESLRQGWYNLGDRHVQLETKHQPLPDKNRFANEMRAVRSFYTV